MRPQPTDVRADPRKLPISGFFLAAALGLTASQAGALGLGDLRLESYLSEPLESSLILITTEEELETLSVDCFSVVAPPTRGLPSLPGARIALERNGSRALLRIRTLAPVSEPVVRFQVTSACSSSGELSREYLLLLDPRPAIDAPVAATAPPAPAVASAPPATAAPPTALPPATVSAVAPPATRPAAAPSATAPPPRQAAAAEAAPSSRGDGAFRLRLSSGELDTSRSAGLDERKRAEIRERRLLLEQDDQTAAVLALRENLRQLESQLAQLQRQVTAARMVEAPEAASAPPPAESGQPRQPPPVAAQSAVDWPWVILGIVLAIAAAALSFWKRRAERGGAGSHADLAPLVSPSPEARGPSQRRPSVVVPERSPQPAASPSRPSPAATPAGDDRHDPGQLRQRYRRTRFPEIARGAISLTDPDSVVRGARTLHEDGATHRAIELLELAIADDPRPVGPWLALLEIQRREGMASAFCALAARFSRQHANAPEWPGVQAIGRQFDPYSGLFAHSGASEPVKPLTDNWLGAPSGATNDRQATALHAAAVAASLGRKPA